MTATISPHAKLPISMPSIVVERGQAVAVGLSVLLHIGAFGLLLGWQPDAPPAAQTTSVEARLIALPTVADTTPAPRAAPSLVAPVAVEPPAPAQEAELARRRTERNEQQHVERQRRESERLERQQREQREQAEQRALAEAQAAQQARQDAERAATAQATAAEAASRRYEPIEKIAPGYPARAMERRIEGDCTVHYTVSASGRVEHPEVVGDCHPLFVVPSLAAAKRFRYQPRVVDGRAVAVPGVTNTFHYRIQPQR